MSKKQFVVIGLGRFGTAVAETIYSLGNDVLAIDYKEESVQNVADKVTHAVQADATDENSLRALGISNFDVAVVSIGEDIQSSIMATLLIKELGVKKIITKATNALHAKVLYKMGVDRVVFPERDMGIRVAHNLVSTNILDYIELSPDYSIAEVITPEDWNNKTLKELDIRANYGISVIAIKREHEVDISPWGNTLIKSGDVVVGIGGVNELNKLEKLTK